MSVSKKEKVDIPDAQRKAISINGRMGGGLWSPEKIKMFKRMRVNIGVKMFIEYLD